MSSTAATSPGTTVSSRIPGQPTPLAVTPVPLRTHTTSGGSRTPRQSSGGSSTPSGGRTLPVPGGGNVSRPSSSNRPTPLQPLIESLPSNHRPGTAHRVCCCF